MGHSTWPSSSSGLLGLLQQQMIALGHDEDGEDDHDHGHGGRPHDFAADLFQAEEALAVGLTFDDLIV